MRLQGLHHVTMFTADARENVRFGAEVLGLRFVKKTIHFDYGQFYHLYFADERATPGAVLTWFELPDAPPGGGRRGDDPHDRARRRLNRRRWTSGSSGSSGPGGPTRRGEGALHFEDHDGLRFGIECRRERHPPLRAEHPEIPAPYAILGIEGARAFADEPTAANPLLTDVLGFTALGGGAYRLDGELRGFNWAYDPAPDTPGVPMGRAAWRHRVGLKDEDHLQWQRRLRDAGIDVTEVKDRDYFRSIYLMEPFGVRFELATLSPASPSTRTSTTSASSCRDPDDVRGPSRGAQQRTLTLANLTTCVRESPYRGRADGDSTGTGSAFSWGPVRERVICSTVTTSWARRSGARRKARTRSSGRSRSPRPRGVEPRTIPRHTRIDVQRGLAAALCVPPCARSGVHRRRRSIAQRSASRGLMYPARIGGDTSRRRPA